jgi:hypothetical protein
MSPRRSRRFSTGVFTRSLIMVGLALALPSSPVASPAAGPAQIGDSLYAAHHPRLLLSPGEIPALSAKVLDGGNDDVAYSFIRLLINIIYPFTSQEDLVGDDFGLSTIPNLGIGSFLETPPDTGARDIGHDLTVYIADNWNVDTDVYASSLRLRALALGYDMFFQNSPDSERTVIRDEIRSYMDFMMTNGAYGVTPLRPYLSNIAAMMASSLGLAAVCLDGETDSTVVDAALAEADQTIDWWLQFQVDENGSYNEGCLYAAWSMRHLIYYFHSRVRYDGYDYSLVPKIQRMADWFAYELLPVGEGRVNNIQDCSYTQRPLPLHNTYFEWSQTVWGTGLSGYLWEHIAGTYGHDFGGQADKAAAALWNATIAPQQPDSILPEHFLWEDRGLYYYRSGWPSGATSNDVVFSFYSGRFQGGHAQEDQNQFTLYGYGADFAIDHGIGNAAKQSEAHNMVFIDGKGQHNAGNSIGTDGHIDASLFNDFGDFLCGDATAAYTTYSPRNNYGSPLPGTDWSWGYSGANPVDFALRNVVVVHDDASPPYFVIFDDIEKDGFPHLYQWRMHTFQNNGIDTASSPLRISDGAAFLDIHALNPDVASLQKSISPFNNLSSDPDANILALSVTDTNPRFVFLLLPGDGTVTPPGVTRTAFPWGIAATVVWSFGKTDVLLVNWSGGTITYQYTTAAPGTVTADRAEPSHASATALSIETDADVAVIRFAGTDPERYILSDASSLSVNDTDLVVINTGTFHIARSQGTINFDRIGVDFVLYAPGISDVFGGRQRIYVIENNGYLTPDPVVAVGGDALPSLPLRVRAYPNPFNPVTTVAVELEAQAVVQARLYDPAGRLVRRLWEGTLPAGKSTLRWDGRNDAGHAVASGVYLLRVTAGGFAEGLKLTIIR